MRHQPEKSTEVEKNMDDLDKIFAYKLYVAKIQKKLNGS